MANLVKYNHLEFDYETDEYKNQMVDKAFYLKIAKLIAILKLANGLDRSHKQKFKNIKISLKEEELIIMADTAEDITLEKGLFDERAVFFEEVYKIRPVIRKKRS